NGGLLIHMSLVRVQPGEPSIALWVHSRGNPPDSIDELKIGTLIRNSGHVRLRLH
ncbi:uncharacterized protein METZ01_LOCUS258133, partial [marine metagenome]